VDVAVTGAGAIAVVVSAFVASLLLLPLYRFCFCRHPREGGDPGLHRG
jgi:hypothetical protein